jgi:predicted alpha/beta superfamily hydrolase
MEELSTQYWPIIELIEDAFEIPQLGKTRRIWALLPHDYRVSGKSYPVLYLQDAQNLFDTNAPFGNWAIDRHLAGLQAIGKGDIIVIAIDHGGTERIKEYSPYYHRKFGEGEGKQYARFIIDTLMPYIDDKYRTNPERNYRGIGGSSMGGLISAYIGLKYQEFFSRLMILSPSFWYTDRIYFDAFSYQYRFPSKIYLYAGEKETPFMTKHINRFKKAVRGSLYQNTITRFKIDINPTGRHQEKYWGEAFSRGVDWLFF